MVAQFNEEFASHALQRISRLLALFSVLGAAAFWIALDWKAGGSFILGSLIAVINFQWLRFSVKKVVNVFLSGAGKRPRIWHKLLLRYAQARDGRVDVNIPAFLTGLLLPVLACMCEAIYEAFVAFQHAD